MYKCYRFMHLKLKEFELNSADIVMMCCTVLIHSSDFSQPLQVTLQVIW